MTDLVISGPANFAPVEALAFGAIGGNAVPVDAQHPLPVAPTIVATTSAPLTGTASSSTIAGPFAPQLGRPMFLTLSGTWTGAVQLLRSIDGGTTKLPITLGGEAWGRFTGNCNEPVWEESEQAATYYLGLTIVTGSASYRVSQ